MIEISLPSSFKDERKYIITVILKEFLGIQFRLKFVDSEDYTLCLENGKKVIIKDHFFSKIKSGTYLKHCYFPNVQISDKVPFTPEDSLPIIYGTDQFEIFDDRIICDIDIFSSSFFMLTRWEEYVNKDRDSQRRFPATSSIAYKFGFLDRPVVNEYVEMLWNIFEALGVEQERKKREFRFILTHDVDHIMRWKGPKQIIRSIGGDLIKRKDIFLAVDHLKEYTMVKTGKRKDPYDTFEWLMDLSESVNTKSQFYFMSGGVTSFDNDYKINEPKALEIIKRVKDRGHVIGFHPSFNSYNDPKQWEFEKTKLEEVVGSSVKEGRQHYLRFEVPTTWQIWADNGMEMDCTLSYADKEGFRCGTCYEFSVFNVLSRMQLPLKEYPLIVMEVSYMTYQEVTPDEMKNKTINLLNKVKKYNGNFVYLWHNSNFNTEQWKRYKSIYEEVLKNN